MTGGDATATGLFAHADLAPGTLVAGRFRIEGLLGVGGMGVVYRARDEALDIAVALKLLRAEMLGRPDAFERFRQELLLARQVSSAHVVRIHDLAQHEGRWLISMDFVDGEGLDRLLDRSGRLPFDDALRIARQIAEGLRAAHAVGVVHRDLKPSNVLIDRAGKAYVNDFGVARSLATSGLTQSGAAVGTPDYLSPEQARGDPVDPRSDLYALGLILYEMIGGELPFSGGTIAEILGQRMVRSPPPLTRLRPDTPDWIARLVDRLLRSQPAHRLQDADAVIAAIDRRAVPRERPQWASIARRAVPVAIVGLVLAGGGWWWMQRAPAPAVPALHRLLLVPAMVDDDAMDRSSPADAAIDDRLLAASAYLRDALDDAGVAVVDGARTAQALRQAGVVDARNVDADALRKLAVADRVLVPRLQRSAGRWHVRAEWRVGDAPLQRLDGPAAADPVAALADAWPMLAQLAGAPARRPPLPAAGALQASGAALRARQAGDLTTALARYRDATGAAPDDARAWLGLAGVASAVGEQDVALAALQRAQRQAGAALPRVERRAGAERALIEGDPTRAVAAWRALAQGRPDDLFAAFNAARALGASGESNSALAQLRAIAQRDDGDPRVWFELGKVSVLQGDARRAVDDYLVRALVLFKRSRDAYGQAETVNALGVAYGRLGQTRDAEEQYRKAVELRGAAGNRRGVATSLRNLSGIVSLRGDFAQAADDLERARALYVALDDRTGLAATETELGLLLEERGDYRAALDAFRRALQAWQRSADAHGIAETLNHIGYAHFQLGAYDNAQAFWQQAATAYAALGDQTGDVRTTQNLGLLDIARGRWADARKRLQRSLAEALRQQMVEEASVSRRNLAELALRQGHLDDALSQADQALASFRQREDDRGQVDAALLRIDALLAAQADAQAQRELDALAAALRGASPEHQAIAALDRAELARRRGAAAEATAALADAERLAATAGVRALQLQVALQRVRQGSAVPSLDADTAGLGHVGLRLGWLEQDVRAALAAHDPARALRGYREAQGLLRAGDDLHAGALHALGAQALRAGGDTIAADAAQAAARTALATLRQHLPPTLRPTFDAAPDIVALRHVIADDAREVAR